MGQERRRRDGRNKVANDLFNVFLRGTPKKLFSSMKQKNIHKNNKIIYQEKFANPGILT